MRPFVRAAATAALASAFVVPALRRKLGTPPAVSAAAAAAGPAALAVLRPRTKLRDAALYGLQMWAFTMVHELPYDDPEALRRRLRIHYPIRSDRAIGGGTLPNSLLQRRLSSSSEPGPIDYFLTWAHWLWFLEPHGTVAWVLLRDNENFPRAARQMAATYDLGCALYFAVPTAPPWWAAEQGHTDTEVRRIMVEVGERFWGRAWPKMYETLGGNPWAAMPSLHFGSSLMAALILSDSDRRLGRLAWAYSAVLGFALVYLGEHYVTDLLAGAALVLVVRKGEPLVEPLALALSGGLQRLERIAA